jgi:ribose transport system permease protein
MNTVKVKQIIQKLGPLLALFVLCAILTIASPNFLSINNLMNILRQTSVNGFISAGMLIVLITAGIDLSVGANAIVGACMMGMLLSKFGVSNPVILLLMAIMMGIFWGGLNGVLLTKLNLPHPFVSTLGMKNFLAGLALFVVSTRTISGFPKAVTWLGSASLFKAQGFSGIPVSFLTMALTFVGFHILLNNTALGRTIYCVGGNPEATRLSGINTDNVLIFVYALSGFVCALAGIVIVGRSGVANPASAIGQYDTDSIAACIIGGASFTGGKGTVAGTLIGALIISVIRNGLTLLNAASDMQYMVIGFVIISAVFIDVKRAAMEAKARRLAGKQ